MKVVKVDPGPPHFHGVVSFRAPRVATTAEPTAEARTFTDVYRRYFDECCRWLQAMGVPPPEVEDLAQEVFVVVHRHLDDRPIENMAGWIFGITRRTVSDHRRRAWWRRLWNRRSEPRGERAEPGPDALGQLERAREAVRVRQLLDQLPPLHRTALVMFELLGYSGDEIAALEGIPVATVWTRLHVARQRFLKLAAQDRKAEEDHEAAH